MRARGPLMMVAALVLAGCGTLPAQRSIRIDMPPAQKNDALADLSIQVQNFTARGLLQEHALAYSDADAPTDIKQAATIAWDETPDVAAGAYLAEALRRAGASVMTPGMGLPPHILNGTVERFELTDGGETGIATVAVDISVVEAKDAKPWLAASYCATARATGKDLPALDRAFDAALADIARHLVDDLAARAKGAPPPAYAPHGSRLQSC